MTTFGLSGGGGFGPEIEAAIAEVRADVARLHGELVRYGLVVWTGGNVSGRVPGADLFVIKPSGVAYDDLDAREHDPLRPRRQRRSRYAGQRAQPVERHRRARVRLPEHARRRRGRAHALHVRGGVGGARRGDPVRHHRRWPTSSAARSRSARSRSSATTRSAAASSRRCAGTARARCSCRTTGPFTIGVSAKDAVKAAVMCEDAARTVHIARRGGPADPDPAGAHRLPLRPLPERLRAERRTTADDAGDAMSAEAIDARAHGARHRAGLDPDQGVPDRRRDRRRCIAVGSHEWENQLRGPHLDLLAGRRVVRRAGRLSPISWPTSSGATASSRRRSARSGSRR